MKTYSKKVSKRTERAERSSSSDDDWVGKEQSKPKKYLNAPVHHQKMMKVIKKVENAQKNKDKPSDTSQKTAPQKRKRRKR